MIYKNTAQLTGWLKNDGVANCDKPEFELDFGEYTKHLKDVQSRPESERKDAAAFRCLTSRRPMTQQVRVVPILTKPQQKIIEDIRIGVFLILIALLVLILFGGSVFAQNTNPSIVVANCGTPPAVYPGAGNRAPNTVNTNGEACSSVSITPAATQDVNITEVGGNPVASTVPVSGTVTVTDGAGAVNVICDSGCGGGTTDTDDGTVAGGQSGAIVIGATYMWNGSDWVRAIGSATDGLTVNLGANNDVTVSDGAGALNVIVDSGTITAVTAISNALPAGTNNIGDVDVLTIAAGDNNIGNVDIVSGTITTVSTVTAVTAISNALPAGNNNIGDVDANATLAAETTKVIGTVRNLGNAGAAFDAAIAAAPPANAVYVAGLQSGATGGLLGGIPICDSFANVNVSTATTTLIVTGVSGRHVHICGINLVTLAANNVAFIAGTGATCGTSTAGMNGGTTAATGWNFAANGGIAHGSGLGAVMRTETIGDSVCVVTSAATQLSGTLSYVIY